MSDEQNSELVRRKGQKAKPSLRNILYDRVRASRDRAVNSNGEVSVEEVESLSRLTRIVEIWDKVAAQQPRNHLLIAGIFLLTLLFASILLFWHVHTTEHLARLPCAAPLRNWELPDRRRPKSQVEAQKANRAISILQATFFSQRAMEGS